MQNEEQRTKIEVGALNKDKMIYYCIYKNECLHKDCAYRQTKSKFSIFDKKNLTISEFTCTLTGKERTILISDERIICNKYKECTHLCPLKTTYLTRTNFRNYFKHEFRQQEPFKCGTTGETVSLQTAEENVGNYISIWNQPNLFARKIAKGVTNEPPTNNSGNYMFKMWE